MLEFCTRWRRPRSWCTALPSLPRRIAPIVVIQLGAPNGHRDHVPVDWSEPFVHGMSVWKGITISQTEVPRLNDETSSLWKLCDLPHTPSMHVAWGNFGAQSARCIHLPPLSERRIPSETWVTWCLRIGCCCGIWERAAACPTGQRRRYRSSLSCHVVAELNEVSVQRNIV